jgi:L-histidine Nalpha-methyltransferase
VLLFMGANIGNMLPAEALEFCRQLRRFLPSGDRLLIGFDLVKSPHKILAAYNDAGGLTRAFNLNLLHRINRELGADFDPAAFSHFPTYDPSTGACKSYLVSERAQRVQFPDQQLTFDFANGETIHTEISQKYQLAETDQLARAAGFEPLRHFHDREGAFLVAVWE